MNIKFKVVGVGVGVFEYSLIDEQNNIIGTMLLYKQIDKFNILKKG